MCLSPVKVRDSLGNLHRYPCGHCSQCLKQYQDAWTARLNEELKQWSPVVQDGKSLPPVVFFTLKYRNDSIPCQYLCLSRYGWYLTDVKPSCKVLEFWTDTRRESRAQWKARRKEMLKEYVEMYHALAACREGVALGSDLSSGLYRLERTRKPRFKIVERQEREYQYIGDSDEPVRDVDGRPLFTVRSFRDIVELDSGFDAFACPDDDLPPGFLGWKRFGTSEEDHPIFDDSLQLTPCPKDQIQVATPVLALEFHTVCKSDVQSWLKRCRARFSRLFPDGDSGRCKCFWKDGKGSEHPYPDSAITATFKYFITSEYGPLTHRPHLHGVLFGVSYDEFERLFAPDWFENFGSVEFSLLRPSGGAITYLSKYCSKGWYEHPYCCKDFLYPSGTEFHSDSYEMSIADFNIDAALVRPTFHLISKGIGARYAFQQEILDYFGVQLSDYVTRKGHLRYSSRETSENSSVRPSLPLGEVLPLMEFDVVTGEVFEVPLSFSESVKVDCLADGSLHIVKLNQAGYIVSESVIPVSAIVDRTVEELKLNQKYNRSYVTSKNSHTAARGTTLPGWHFIGMPGLGGLKVRQTSISLPRYYRQFLLPPLSSALRSAAAKRLHPDMDAEATRAIQRLGPEDQADPWIKSKLVADEMRRFDSTKRFWERSRNDFRPYGDPELD